MKTMWFGLFVLTIAAQLLAAQQVLKVNGVPVSKAELVVAQRSLQAQLPPDQRSDQKLVLRHAVDQVIGHALLVQAATQAGISVDPAEVQRNVDAQRAKIHDKAGFEAELAQAGLSQQDLVTMEKERLLVMRFVEKVLGPTVVVSADDVKVYYAAHPNEFGHPAQIRIRMVLAKVPDGASQEVDAAAKERIEAALQRLKAGEDFAKVASEMSDDPSKANGGEIGWVRRGMLLPSLEPAVFSLNDGEITGVLKSRYGYHIFKTEEHRSAGLYPLDEIQDRLTAALEQRGLGEAAQRFVAEQRSKATIEALDPGVKAVLDEERAAAPAKDKRGGG
jgi:parvulin-like peptidyl-prolyl isomerase